MEKKYKNDPENREIIKSFENFTSYFTGFNENRKNFYKDDNKVSSIAHRIVVDNFRRYNSNINKFNAIKELIPEITETIQHSFVQYFPNVKVNDLCEAEGFNQLLTQKGIEMYNTILGGFSPDGVTKVKGINEIVNEFCQQNPAYRNQSRSMLASPLYNQILSEKESNSFVFDILENDEDVYRVLSEINDSYADYSQKAEQLFNVIKNADAAADLEETRRISNRVFRDYSRIEHLLNKPEEKSFECKEIFDVVKQSDPETEVYSSLDQYYEDAISLINTVKNDYNEISPNDTKKLRQQNETIQSIKSYLDDLLEISRTLKHYSFKNNEYLSLLSDEVQKYGDEVVTVYNKVRNYLTKKAYSDDKIKLNFNNVQLASGWSLSKEKEYRSIILLKDNRYYLGIYNSSKSIDPNGIPGEDCFRKMKYEYVPGIFKMLPKCVFTKAVKEHFKTKKDDFELFDKKTFDEPFTVTYDLWKIYTNGMFKKDYVKHGGDERVYRRSLNTWISKCMEMFRKYKNWKAFDLSSLKEPDEYSDVSEFYAELDNCAYQISFVDVNTEAVNRMIESGEMFLFQIYSKDFAKGTHGRKDLNTMYFESLFTDYNLKNHIYQLNGGAELFWRKASLEKDVTHRKGSILVNKTTIDDETIPSEIYVQLYKYGVYKL